MGILGTAKNMVMPFAPTLFGVVLIYIGVGLLLVLFERKLVYLPEMGNPPDFGECFQLTEAEAMEYEGVRFYHKKVDEDRVAVLYHGNAGSVCDRAPFASTFETAGYSYILVEYPGYAGGTESLSKKQILEETHRVQTFLEAEGYSEIVLVGESLGSGPAAYHASFAPPKKIILVSPYNELADGAGWIGQLYPLALLMRENYMPGKWLENVNIPTYLIRAEHDEIFPRESVTKLREQAGGETELVEIENVTHNELYADPALYSSIHKSLSR